MTAISHEGIRPGRWAWATSPDLEERDEKDAFMRPHRKLGLMHLKHQPGEGLPDMTPWRWQDDAACKGQDVNMFVPESTRGPIVEPMSYCAECPVLQTCLDWAVEHDEKGIWGGTTDRQREYIRQGHIHPCPEGCGREGYGTNNEKCTPCANWARGARTRGKKAIAA